MLQGHQRGQPVGGQQFGGLGVAIALYRLAGVEVFPQAAMDAGENRRRCQVGVGVGTADAVLDVPAIGRAAGHPQAHGAVVDAPGGGQGRVAVALETPVGVGVGAEQQQRLQQGREHATHRLAQQRGAGRVLAGEQVAARGVGDAHVHVHAGAGQVIERLGHEGGLHPVLVGHGLDQALVAHGLVHGFQGVAVFQGDLHLPGGVFGDRRARRNALQLAGGVEVGEERFDLLQLAQAVDLGAARATAIGVQRRLRPAIAVALGVQQVELQLAGHHRVVTLGLEPVDHLDQQVARVGDAGGQALLRVHADLHRGGRDLPPGQAYQAAGQGGRHGSRYRPHPRPGRSSPRHRR